MSSTLSANETAAVFRYAGDDCLYRDHNGHRVLADVEGAGHFRVLAASRSATLLLDDEPARMFEGAYDRSLLVSSPEPGDSAIAAATGRTGPPVGPVQRLEKFKGCGWIIAATAVLQIDGDHRPRPSPSPDFPYPVFQSAEGQDLQIIRAEQRSLRIDGFSMDDPEALKTRCWKVQNISVVTELEAEFPDGTRKKGPVVSHLNTASWNLEVPADCSGLIVRKLYDAFHGRQRARILIDSKFQGWWWAPVQDRRQRWRWTQFGLDLEPSGQPRVATISIDPPAGSPLWSVSEIEILALFPT